MSHQHGVTSAAADHAHGDVAELGVPISLRWEGSSQASSAAAASPSPGDPLTVVIAVTKSQAHASGCSTTFVIVDADEDAGASKSATWLHSTYHNVTAMLGAGVLGLPYTFAALGWVGGLSVLCGALLVSLFTFTLLVHLHENGPTHRFSRYHELCEHAWGKRRGSWALLVFQIPFIFGLAVTYSVTGGESLGAFVALVRSRGTDSDSSSVLPLSAWIVMFSFVEVLLAQLPNLDSLAWVSGVGAAMSIVYSVGASVLSLRSAEPRSEVDFTPGAGGGAGSASAFGSLQQIMAMCSAVTTIFFAYGGQNIAMEIQATLPFPPTTVQPMMQGVYGAFTLTFMCYTLTASSGYYAFGSSAKANILQSSGSNPLWLLAGCHLGVMLHVLASYQVYSSPLLELINSLLTQAFPQPATVAAGAHIKALDCDEPHDLSPSDHLLKWTDQDMRCTSDLQLRRDAGVDIAAVLLEEAAGAHTQIAIDGNAVFDQETLLQPLLGLPTEPQLSSSKSPSAGLAGASPTSWALLSMSPSRQRFLVTLVYVGTSCSLACLIPFFGSLMGLIGAIGAVPTNFVIPCLLWLKLREPKPWVSATWWLCWSVVVLGSLIGVFGAMGAVYGIHSCL